ncbi:hypothetical protein EJA05_06305 [Pseudomonas oryziphila]|uniref:Uncharacterized protein n=2 Tax=Pseudomonas TaxID=286 RepID=A0ABM7CY84_9PSED|nr:hypothetical protein EJA05_06305 [Pseudomonas oryziphila]AZL76442.1 hypothetical protein EI693_06065 [Pseudomonas oryziphila]
MADREAHCASSGLCFTRFYGPDSRDPGAGPPENLKTVTRGFLAVPAKDHVAKTTRTWAGVIPHQ